MLEVLLGTACVSFAGLVISIFMPDPDISLRERLGNIAIAGGALLVSGALLALAVYEKCGPDFTCYR